MDFSSVLQTVNGNPTMFVLPNFYLGVQIEGFGAAMWGSLLLTVLNIAVALVLGPIALPLL